MAPEFDRVRRVESWVAPKREGCEVDSRWLVLLGLNGVAIFLGRGLLTGRYLNGGGDEDADGPL